MASQSFRLGIIQLAVSYNKKQTVENACKLVQKAVNAGAKVVVLPECFNCPYGTQYFADYAEKIPGETTTTMAKLASETKAYLVAGSIPEEDNGKLYNTCTVFNPQGEMIAKHRKIHLFDIDIPGGITFKESDVLSPGNSLTTFETDDCKIGVGICYDIRFAELGQLYCKEGCKLLLYPGAFNMTTGPVHWETILKARALDNQMYAAAVSPARDETASYIAWGHSTVVGPWGDILAKAGKDEEIIYADIDLQRLEQIRKQIPLGTQRRHDLYQIVTKS